MRVTIPNSLEGSQSFDLNITRGLLNPYSGPYSYSNYLIETQTSLGHSIDSLTVSENSIADESFIRDNPDYKSHIQI